MVQGHGCMDMGYSIWFRISPSSPPMTERLEKSPFSLDRASAWRFAADTDLGALSSLVDRL